MKRIWSEFLESIGNILRLLRQGRHRVALVGPAGDAWEEPAWDNCESLLDSVLVPKDEYAYLKCRIVNGRHLAEEAEVGAAAYELTLALRRARKLRRLYG